jgi:type IV pilus assembly protein PilO
MSVATPSVWRERLGSPLTWHFAGAGVLLVLAVALGSRFAMDLSATSTRSEDALATKQTELKLAELQTAPMRGLDKKILATQDAIADFYAKRIPASYSAIETSIDALQVNSGVRLSRLQYTQGKTNNNLTEITMDAGISGEYPQIMKFVNSVERDKTFFVVREMLLTGQQGGMVNLRLRVSTWLRPADVPAGLPMTESLEHQMQQEQMQKDQTQQAGGKEDRQP